MDIVRQELAAGRLAINGLNSSVAALLLHVLSLNVSCPPIPSCTPILSCPPCPVLNMSSFLPSPFYPDISSSSWAAELTGLIEAAADLQRQSLWIGIAALLLGAARPLLAIAALKLAEWCGGWGRLFWTVCAGALQPSLVVTWILYQGGWKISDLWQRYGGWCRRAPRGNLPPVNGAAAAPRSRCVVS